MLGHADLVLSRCCQSVWCCQGAVKKRGKIRGEANALEADGSDVSVRRRALRQVADHPVGWRRKRSRPALPQWRQPDMDLHLPECRRGPKCTLSNLAARFLAGGDG